LRQGGMAAVGKHFPGHGHVAADSHTDLPVDGRSFREIEVADLVPFEHLIRHGLAGIMPAHVVYPKVDDKPAGFSRLWLADILRNRMQFDGVIFSDDLSMEGARVAGSIVERGEAAIDAGCDMILVCNNPAAADELLAGLQRPISAPSLARLARLHGHGPAPNLVALRESDAYSRAVHDIGGLGMGSANLNLAGAPPVGERG
jgi:beta-N-acetylhexosaminidase